jgi:hypothetical protein
VARRVVAVDALNHSLRHCGMPGDFADRNPGSYHPRHCRVLKNMRCRENMRCHAAARLAMNTNPGLIGATAASPNCTTELQVEPRFGETGQLRVAGRGIRLGAARGTESPGESGSPGPGSKIASWRIDLNANISAMTTPMPGIVASRWLSRSALWIGLSVTSIRPVWHRGVRSRVREAPASL